MSSHLKSLFSGKELEDLLFRAALIISIPFLSASIIFDLVNQEYSFVLLDLSLIAISMTMLVMYRNERFRKMLINVFSLIIISAFIFFWSKSGGIHGSGAYIFPAISILVILITRGISKIIFSTILALLVLSIAVGWGNSEVDQSYTVLLFDFVLNMVILAVLLVFFKNFLDNERNKLEKKKLDISRLNSELNLKTTELELYNRDLELMKKNLEKVAEKHDTSLEMENKKIIEYSFINAHLVRAPLTNIIGISELIEDKNEKINSLNENAKRFDKVLHKINGVLSR